MTTLALSSKRHLHRNVQNWKQAAITYLGPGKIFTFFKTLPETSCHIRKLCSNPTHQETKRHTVWRTRSAKRSL